MQSTELLVLTDKSRADLAQRAAKLSVWCSGHPNARLQDLCFSINTQPCDQSCRLAMVATSLEDLVRKATHAAGRLQDEECKRINERSGIYYYDEPLGRQNRTSFLFPGEGSQYPNMLRELCLSFPDVRLCFDLLERAVHPQSGTPSPRDYIFPPSAEASECTDGEGQLWQMAGAVEAVLTANRAILAVLGQLKIVPDAVLGHSTGEYSALLASGALRMDDEEELVRHLRDGNRLSQQLLNEGKIAKGSLLAVGPADPEVIAPALDRHRDSAWVAIDNCPRQIVLFATESSIADLENDLRQAGILCQKLPFDRAYHTPLFAPVRNELAKLFANYRICSPAIDTYSCSTARLYPSDPDEIRELALTQWSSPVRFRESIENMYANGVRIFIEVGPRGNLSAFVSDILRGRPHAAIPMDLATIPGLTQLHHALGRLAANHVPMNLDYLYARRKVKQISFEDSGTTTHPSSAQRLSLALPIMAVTSTGLARNTLPGTGAIPGTLANPGNGHASRSAFLSEYMKTMERFLDTQQALLAAYGRQRTAVVETHKHSQEIHDGSHNGDRHKKEAAVSPVVAVLEPESNTTANSSVEDMLLDVVTQKTGYPRAILSLSANLEAHLGIDSIKRVEILGALQQKIGPLPAGRLDEISRMRTLQDIVDAVKDGGSAIRQVVSQPVPPDAKNSAFREHPLLGTMVEFTEGKEVRTVKVFDLDHDLFLNDHALGGGDSTPGGLVVLPLTIIVESLAQVAAALAPGKQLVGIRDIRVTRWAALERRSLRVQMSARVHAQGALQVTASLAEASDDKSSSPSAEATFIFGDRLPLPPSPMEFRLSSARESRWQAGELYAHGMFHKGVFRGVTSVERVGGEGIEATLQVAQQGGLFRTSGDPGFLTSPLLLDAAGQLVGFWTVEQLSHGYVVFPFHVRSIEFYGPPPRPGETLIGRALVSHSAESRLLADIEVLGSDHSVRIRVLGWEDKRIDMPKEFFRFRLDPLHHVLSRKWSEVLSQLPPDHGFHLYRLDLEPAFLSSDGGIWRSVLAHIVLGAQEMNGWQSLSGPVREQWLLDRVVAKDAIRGFLNGNGSLHPARLELRLDESGSGIFLASNGASGPNAVLSISHGPGFAAAVVADGAKYGSLGIDTASLDHAAQKLDQVLISDAERHTASQCGAAQSTEWILRISCARKAIAKGLGLSLNQAFSGLTMCGLDATTGTIYFDPDRNILPESQELESRRFVVHTVREGELILAIAGRTKL